MSRRLEDDWDENTPSEPVSQKKQIPVGYWAKGYDEGYDKGWNDAIISLKYSKLNQQEGDK